jgi:hypothetical protein
MEEYAEYLDENGMITIKWWVSDDGSVSSPSHPVADYDTDADADEDIQTLS